MLLESVFETLRRIENERLQLPIFYESPIALRFETGDPSLDIFLDKTHLNPKYLRSAFWRVSFLYEKIAPFVRSFGYCIARGFGNRCHCHHRPLLYADASALPRGGLSAGGHNLG